MLLIVMSRLIEPLLPCKLQSLCDPSRLTSGQTAVSSKVLGQERGFDAQESKEPLEEARGARREGQTRNLLCVLIKTATALVSPWRT